MIDLGDSCPDLLVRCHQTPCTLGEFADRAHAFMADLIPLHPGFAHLRFVAGRSKARSPALAPDLSNLRAGIFQYGWDREGDKRWFTALDAEDKPTAGSRSSLGFKLVLSNWTGWDDKIDVAAQMGSSLGDGCDATFPRKAFPELRQQPLAGRILAVFVDHWPVHYASYATRVWNRAVHFTDDQKDNMEIGWLNYVDDVAVAEALPPDLECTKLGKGVMFQLGDHLLDPADETDVALAARVKQSLAAAGWLRVRTSSSE